MPVNHPFVSPSLEDLERLPDAARRGRALEQYVARLFRARHFTVILNPRAASPRQTDLIAVKLDDRYLIECKWRSKPATINDVDALRSRLHRTSQDAVGVLISMQGFTEEVKIDVRYQRQQPVLLLSGQELRKLASGFGASLPALLYRKKEALLRDATVLLDDIRAPKRRSANLPYPQPQLQFASLNGQARTPVIDCRGGFDPVTFSDRLVDIDWAPATGAGVSLDLRPEFADEAEVLRGFDVLLDHGWVSEDGRWSIHQLERTWHGIGLEALIAEMPRWQQRAHHHSEQISYVDRCDGGFYSLMIDIAANRRRWVSYVELSFQLEGWPLDSTPLIHLCRALGIHDHMNVRPRKKRSIKLWHPRPEVTDVVPRWYVIADEWVDVETEDPWVTGIVIDNPFPQRNTSSEPDVPLNLAALRDSEFLICDLRHHHPQSQQPASYFLHHIEWAWASSWMVCRPVADWSV